LLNGLITGKKQPVLDTFEDTAMQLRQAKAAV
jgi:hypothetical protein